MTIGVGLIVLAVFIRRHSNAPGSGMSVTPGDASAIVALPYFAMALMLTLAAILGASCGHLRVMFHFWKLKDGDRSSDPRKT